MDEIRHQATGKIAALHDQHRTRAHIEVALDKLLKITQGQRNVMVQDRDATALLSLFWQTQKPIPMLLFCPACGAQHIDAPRPAHYRHRAGETLDLAAFSERFGGDVQAMPSDWRAIDAWENPPHKTHQCQACFHMWRPCDIATTGIDAIKTKGANDGSAIPAQRPGG